LSFDGPPGTLVDPLVLVDVLEILTKQNVGLHDMWPSILKTRAPVKAGRPIGKISGDGAGRAEYKIGEV